MKKILVILSIYIASLNAIAGNIDPAQAFGEAVKISNGEVRFKLGWNTKVYKAKVSRGKYADRLWGQYVVELNTYDQETNDNYLCISSVSISEQPFAKRRRSEVILEDGMNSPQIIGEVLNLDCNKI
jgi:hypothetical protein